MPADGRRPRVADCRLCGSRGSNAPWPPGCTTPAVSELSPERPAFVPHRRAGTHPPAARWRCRGRRSSPPEPAAPHAQLRSATRARSSDTRRSRPPKQPPGRSTEPFRAHQKYDLCAGVYAHRINGFLGHPSRLIRQSPQPRALGSQSAAGEWPRPRPGLRCGLFVTRPEHRECGSLAGGRAGAHGWCRFRAGEGSP